jgi:hypothetical protein
MYLRKSLPLPLIFILALLMLSGSAQARRPQVAVGCSHAVTAKQAIGLADAVWSPDRWQRDAPKPAALAAHRRQVRCAAGPGHRAAIKRRWEASRAAFYRQRHRCSSGTLVTGRVSYFGGGLEASGHFTSEPGIALNIAPGTEGGWDNPITRGWVETLQRFWVAIDGHTAILPVTELGPAGFTGRAIDVTEGGVGALGLTGAFPTDAIGTAQLVPVGCI